MFICNPRPKRVHSIPETQVRSKLSAEAIKPTERPFPESVAPSDGPHRFCDQQRKRYCSVFEPIIAH